MRIVGRRNVMQAIVLTVLAFSVVGKEAGCPIRFTGSDRSDYPKAESWRSCTSAGSTNPSRSA